MRIGIIDVGTNSVLLLIAKVKNGSIQPLLDIARITRLGEQLNKTGILNDTAQQRTLAVLKEYNQLCQRYSVDLTKAIGTEPLRKAHNAQKFIQLAKDRSGVELQILSQDEEAALIYLASQKCFGTGITVMDIGGGSTEIVYPSKETRLGIIKLDIGSVNLTEQFCRSDPITNNDFNALITGIRNKLCSIPPIPKSGQLIGTAGTITTLAAIHLRLETYRPGAVHGTKVTMSQIDKIIRLLRTKTISSRKKLRGINPKRADIILAGALLAREILNHLRYHSLIVSDRGVRWGVAYRLLTPDSRLPTISS